jgi:hypothetical protein
MDAVRPVEPGFSPLDEELGLLPGSLSPTVHQAVVRLGTAMPFGQAPSVPALLGRVTLSPATVCRLTERAGAALVAVEEARVAEIERTFPASPVGAPCQQVSIDGAMVPLVDGEWREAKTLVIGTLSPQTPGRAQALSYASTSQGIDQLLRLATGELHRRGTFAAEQVVGVMDGAVWCQSFFDYHLPAAVRILDFPHAVEHLNAAAQSVFGVQSDAAQDWLAQQRQTLREGDPGQVVDAVAALPVDQAADPEAAATVCEKVGDYLRARLPQMRYAEFAGRGWPIGSGSVESANKVVVEARLKGAGMHWQATHVDAMLALRCALCSERWDAAWLALSQQRRQAAHRSHPRPRPVVLPPAPRVPPASPPARPPDPPRAKTIVNGKPTKDHPWKRRFLPPRIPTTPAISKC